MAGVMCGIDAVGYPAKDMEDPSKEHPTSLTEQLVVFRAIVLEHGYRTDMDCHNPGARPAIGYSVVVLARVR